jgi:hypothetical protein
MDDFIQCEFDFVHPTLLDGVAQCKAFGRPAWIMKFVTLTNKNENDVANGICHNINVYLVCK